MENAAGDNPEDNSHSEPLDTDHSPGAIAFFGLVFCGALFAFFSLFWAYVTDFILAFTFTALFWGSYQRLLARLNGRKLLASALVTCSIAILVAVPTGFIITSLSVEAAAFYNSTLSSLSLERIEDFLFGDEPQAVLLKRMAELAGLEWTPTLVRDAIARVSGTVAEVLYELVSNQLSNIFALLFHFLIMLLIVFYMFVDGEQLKQYVFETSPLPDEEEELLAQKFAAVGRATLFGNGFGSAIQGVIGAISMVVVGLPSPILWGVVMTIFAFLPLVGVSVVTIPAALYLGLTGKWVLAAVFFGFNFIQALIVENVVKTRLIGSHMRMHSLLIFLSIMGGLGLFGIIGLFYGPLIVALFLTLADLYHQRYKQHILQGRVVIRSPASPSLASEHHGPNLAATTGPGSAGAFEPGMSLDDSGPLESAELDREGADLERTRRLEPDNQ
ncbi:MAG: AI-2E family transporter [Myxococcota bacterium]